MRVGIGMIYGATHVCACSRGTVFTRPSAYCYDNRQVDLGTVMPVNRHQKTLGTVMENEILRRFMDQETRWLTRYNEVKAFIEEHHRNPSKYYSEEKLMVHFLKRGRKLMNAGELKEERLEKFKELLEIVEENKRKNQYV